MSSGVHQGVRGSLRELCFDAPRMASCTLSTSSSAKVLMGRCAGGGVSRDLAFSQSVEPILGQEIGSVQSVVIRMVA